jgi:hypothetical protein
VVFLSLLAVGLGASPVAAEFFAYVLAASSGDVLVIDTTPGSLTYHSTIATAMVKGYGMAITPIDIACTNLWKMQWFGYEFGHDNTCILQWDSTPVCGSGKFLAPPKVAGALRSWRHAMRTWAMFHGLLGASETFVSGMIRMFRSMVRPFSSHHRPNP